MKRNRKFKIILAVRNKKCRMNIIENIKDHVRA